MDSGFLERYQSRLDLALVLSTRSFLCSSKLSFGSIMTPKNLVLDAYGMSLPLNLRIISLEAMALVLPISMSPCMDTFHLMSHSLNRSRQNCRQIRIWSRSLFERQWVRSLANTLLVVDAVDEDAEERGTKYAALWYSSFDVASYRFLRSTLTTKVRPMRNSRIQYHVLLSRSFLCSLSRRPSCQTLSKAFSMSKRIARDEYDELVLARVLVRCYELLSLTCTMTYCCLQKPIGNVKNLAEDRKRKKRASRLTARYAVERRA